VIAQPVRGPIVIDTDVYGAELVPGSTLAVIYEPIIVGRAAFISFQTAAELLYGALRRNWGASRMRNLRARIAAARPCTLGLSWCLPTPGFASTASASVTRWPSASTTQTGGSRQPPYALGPTGLQRRHLPQRPRACARNGDEAVTGLR